MKRFVSLVTAIALVLTGTRVVRAEVPLFDRSCNALQHVQQEARLKQMENANAPGAKEYRKAVADFKVEMHALFKQSEKLEEQYNTIRTRLASEILQERTDLVAKYREQVASQRTDLVERARSGDATADRDFSNAVLAAIEKDLEFGNELRRRVDQDNEAGAIKADAFKLQVNQFHELEVKMAMNRWKAPPDATSQRMLRNNTTAFVREQGYESVVQVTVFKSRAMTDLMTVKSAIQSGMNASLEIQNEAGAMSLRDRYDTPVPDATVGLVDVAPVLATPIARGVMRQLEAERLQTVLDLHHVGQHAPGEAKERGLTVRDPEKPIAAPIAETVGAALERHRRVREGYQRLSKFKEPPPPETSPSPEPKTQATKVKEWATEVATNLEKAAVRTKFVLIDDDNAEEDEEKGDSK